MMVAYDPPWSPTKVSFKTPHSLTVVWLLALLTDREWSHYQLPSRDPESSGGHRSGEKSAFWSFVLCYQQFLIPEYTAVAMYGVSDLSRSEQHIFYTY
jgi:hypothetical protein